MLPTHHTRHIAHLLSVALFQVMEECEKDWRNNPESKMEQKASEKNLDQLIFWLTTFLHLDKKLPQQDRTMMTRKLDDITSGQLETRLNAIALTLMALDDHYTIFQLSAQKEPNFHFTNPSHIPILTLQDIQNESKQAKSKIIKG